MSNITTGSPILDTLLCIVIFVVIFGLIIIIPMGLLGRAGKAAKAKEKELLKTGIQGEARIIELGASRTGRSDQKTHVALRLDVTPITGERFNAITSWVIEPIHSAEIQVGKIIPVKIVDVVGKGIKAKQFKSVFPLLPWAQLYYWEQEFDEKSMKAIDDEDSYN